MLNPYLPKNAIIRNIQPQTPEVKLFTLYFKNKKDQMDFSPGQFVETGLPGFGEAPFALCSKQIKVGESDFQICVKKTGQLTEKLHQLKIDDFVTVRGPYGNGWPLENQKSKVCPESFANAQDRLDERPNQKLLLIAGGLGIIPLRPLILQAKKLQPTNLFYGAKTYDDLLFKDEYRAWEEHIDLHITLDKPDPRWKGCTGLITNLIESQSSIFKCQVSIFLCGPPVMYKFAIQKLKELKIPDENIFLSLERRMHCGIGTCQHCAIGSKYVCKDGPIFSYAEIKNVPGAI